MKLSVAFIVYNGSNYMEQQLDSILNQTVKVDEIVVCEDNSTDNTKEILEKYNKSNPGLFKILHNTQNLGSNKNAEKAIQHCTGDIVFLSDQDDEWFDNKVSFLRNFFLLNKVDVIVHDAKIRQLDNLVVNNSLFSQSTKKHHILLFLDEG